MGLNLPILDSIIRDTATRALYLFPTKARIRWGIGDTPQDARKAIRSKAHIVMPSPDMLHKGILPHHTKYVKLFENLKYVVIDAELATALTGKPVEWIQESGAPRGERYFAIYNLPVVNRQLWKSEVGLG